MLSSTWFLLTLKLKPETACCTLNLYPVEFRKLTLTRAWLYHNHIMQMKFTCLLPINHIHYPNDNMQIDSAISKTVLYQVKVFKMELLSHLTLRSCMTLIAIFPSSFPWSHHYHSNRPSSCALLKEIVWDILEYWQSNLPFKSRVPVTTSHSRIEI